MSQSNGRKVSYALPKVVQPQEAEPSANPEATFTTAKKLWQKEVWWKTHEQQKDPQSHVDQKT